MCSYSTAICWPPRGSRAAWAGICGSVVGSAGKRVYQGIGVGAHESKPVAITERVEVAKLGAGQIGDAGGLGLAELRLDENGLGALLLDGVDRGLGGGAVHVAGFDRP